MINNSIVFIDSEFTTLGADGKHPEFLSIGACTLDGSKEFYAEINEWDPRNVSSFTREEVIPLLWRNEYKKEIKEISINFKQWIESFKSPVTIAMDSVWDWSWVIAIAEGNNKINPIAHQVFEHQLPYWAENLSERWLHLNFTSFESKQCQEIVMQTKQEHLQIYKAHHALLDARCNAKICCNILNHLNLKSTDLNVIQWSELFENTNSVYVSDQAAFGCTAQSMKLYR